MLLRPVLNVFECFSGVEQAEHKASSDELCREVGLAQEIAKDSSSKTWFLDSLKKINTFDDGFLTKMQRQDLFWKEEGRQCMYTSVGRLDVVLTVSLW